MNVATALGVELNREFEKLNEMEVGTESYRITVDGRVKLMDRAIEYEKIDKDETERFKSFGLECNKHDEDKKYRQAQLEEEKKARRITNYITAAGILLQLGVTVWGTVVSLNFEKTGTVTTLVGRGYVNKLIPKK